MISSGVMAAILSLLLDRNAQSISFGSVPALTAGTNATVTAVATSKLPVTFSSKTPAICSVGANDGTVTGIAAGTCTIAADQAGNGDYEPAPQVVSTIAVAPAPHVPVAQTISLGVSSAVRKGEVVTISALASSNLPVAFSNKTPEICFLSGSGNPATVTGTQVGICKIAADQPGNADFLAAPQVELTIAVVLPPDAPSNVKASLGNEPNTVIVAFDAPGSGSSPITGYSVVGTKSDGTTQSTFASAGTASPITVTCPVSCSGYAFSVAASDAVVGIGTASAQVDIVTRYKVVETFTVPEVDTGIPRSIVFDGTFLLNSTKGSVSGLTGTIPQYRGSGVVELKYQNSVETFTDGGKGGLLVTTFARDKTDTFSDPVGGNIGWTPQLGVWLGGFTTLNTTDAANAYARIFVNIENPLTPLTQAQIDRLAYTECTKDVDVFVCMFATSWISSSSENLELGNWGVYVGNWYGYPVSQIITKQ